MAVAETGGGPPPVEDGRSAGAAGLVGGGIHDSMAGSIKACARRESDRIGRGQNPRAQPKGVEEINGERIGAVREIGHELAERTVLRRTPAAGECPLVLLRVHSNPHLVVGVLRAEEQVISKWAQVRAVRKLCNPSR